MFSFPLLTFLFFIYTRLRLNVFHSKIYNSVIPAFSMEKRVAFVKDYGAYLKVEKGLIVCKLKGNTLWSVSPAELHSIFQGLLFPQR